MENIFPLPGAFKLDDFEFMKPIFGKYISTLPQISGGVILFNISPGGPILTSIGGGVLDFKCNNIGGCDIIQYTPGRAYIEFYL